MPVLLGDTLYQVNTGQSIKLVWNFGTLVGLCNDS